MSVPALDPELLPTVDDIGALLRSRTQDTNDQELGTFATNTRPTAAQVELLIAQAASVVFSSTGDLSDLTCIMADQVRGSAKYLISLLTACLVELSYFPEQVRNDRSAFQGYYDILTSEQFGMRALIDAVAECKGGEIEPDQPGGAGSQRASWAFPVDLGGLVGWQSKW